MVEESNGGGHGAGVGGDGDDNMLPLPPLRQEELGGVFAVQSDEGGDRWEPLEDYLQERTEKLLRQVEAEEEDEEEEDWGGGHQEEDEDSMLFFDDDDYFANLMDEGAKQVERCEKMAGVSGKEARRILSLEIYYLEDVEMLLGPAGIRGSEEERRLLSEDAGLLRTRKNGVVLDDVDRLRKATSRDNPPSFLGPKVLQCYLKHLLLEGENENAHLREAVRGRWDAECSLRHLLALSAAASAGRGGGDPTAAEVQEEVAELKKALVGKGSLWAHVAQTGLQAAGVTNGIALCLRGETFATSTGLAAFPFVPPGKNGGGEDGDKMSLPFPPLDGMIAQWEKAKAAPAPPQPSPAPAPAASNAGPPPPVPHAAGGRRLSSASTPVSAGSCLIGERRRSVMTPVAAGTEQALRVYRGASLGHDFHGSSVHNRWRKSPDGNDESWSVSSVLQQAGLGDGWDEGLDNYGGPTFDDDYGGQGVHLAEREGRPTERKACDQRRAFATMMAKSKENVGEILKAVPFDKALEIQTEVDKYVRFLLANPDGDAKAKNPAQVTQPGRPKGQAAGSQTTVPNPQARKGNTKRTKRMKGSEEGCESKKNIKQEKDP